ncbi:MAG: carboxypeptidase-like regulatory domain-containing protein [Planctomycetota bacterium]
MKHHSAGPQPLARTPLLRRRRRPSRARSGIAAAGADSSIGDPTGEDRLADGTYVLAGLPAGTYRVEFSAPGYVTLVLPAIEVAAGAATSGVNAALTPE